MANENHTPWEAKEALGYTGDVGIIDGGGRLIAEAFSRIDSSTRVDAKARADFIVRACNAHDALVTALQDADGALRFHPGRDNRLPVNIAKAAALIKEVTS